MTGDTVDVRLRGATDTLYGKLGDPGHVEMLRALLELDFDHILTTNFSYELEMAAREDLHAEDSWLKSIMHHTDPRRQAEAKYLLYTYADLRWKEHQTRLWHIHGEGRKPDSMILGHYYYANLLEKITAYLRGEGNRYALSQTLGEPTRIRSWADAFLLGDVYVLGFGFDVSEFDLWWLLNRKKKERAETGSTHFFSPAERLEPGEVNEKEELLRVLDVTIHHCGTVREDGTPLERSACFRRFYVRAIAEIRQLMHHNKF